MVVILNEVFEDFGIDFYLCAPASALPFQHLKDYSIQNAEELFSFHHPRAINIFVVDRIGDLNSLAFASFPGSKPRIVISSSAINGKIVVHEMGHIFGLYHTHGKTNNDRSDELVDGSNCETAGDDICDTAADPNLKYEPISNCVYEGNSRDTNGDLYQPDPENYMSYSYPYCLKMFTPGQTDAVRAVAGGGYFTPMLQGPEMKPDLAFNSFSLNGREDFASGTTMQLDFVIQKGGCEALEAGLKLALYLSRDLRVSEEDILLQQRELPAFEAGWDFWEACDGIQLTGEIERGEWNLIAVLDDGQEVLEWREWNNIHSVPVNILRGGALKESSFYAYPNPSTGEFSISMSNDFVGTVEFELIDQQGRLVRTWQSNKVQQCASISAVSLPNLTHGQYIIRGKWGSTLQTAPLIIRQQAD